jgi:hypothetical protein
MAAARTTASRPGDPLTSRFLQSGQSYQGFSLDILTRVGSEQAVRHIFAIFQAGAREQTSTISDR